MTVLHCQVVPGKRSFVCVMLKQLMIIRIREIKCSNCCFRKGAAALTVRKSCTLRTASMILGGNDISKPPSRYRVGFDKELHDIVRLNILGSDAK